VVSESADVREFYRVLGRLAEIRARAALKFRDGDPGAWSRRYLERERDAWLNAMSTKDLRDVVATLDFTGTRDAKVAKAFLAHREYTSTSRYRSDANVLADRMYDVHVSRCGDNTCVASISHDQGLYMLAIEDIPDSDFDGINLSPFQDYEHLEVERRILVATVSHRRCKCGAWLWDVNDFYSDVNCSDCLALLPAWKKRR